MDKQVIAELEWEARREDAAQRPRTKEDLILTQQHLAAEMYYNPAAIAFAFGEFEKARFLIVDAAGREWEQSFLRDFDLKLVNEQGAMLCEGSVPMRACGPAAVFRWTAGEMFADVAARGAAMVRDAVKEHPAPKVHKEISGTMATQWTQVSRAKLLDAMLAIGSAHAGEPLTHAELLDRLRDPAFRAKFNGRPPEKVVFKDEATAAFAEEFEKQMQILETIGDKLRAKREARAALKKSPPPRYDEVFFEGMNHTGGDVPDGDGFESAGKVKQ